MSAVRCRRPRALVHDVIPERTRFAETSEGERCATGDAELMSRSVDEIV